MDDATGRQNIWNFLLRTSLSGEFAFRGLAARSAAIVLGVCLLLVLVIALERLIRFRWMRLFDQVEAFPFAISVALYLGSIVYLRSVSPFSCSADFRYILPIR
jgi:hypothetical protein